MAIAGHGIDMVERARVAALLERHGERFLERCFTPAERAYADANPRRRAEHLAARFGAKEAVLKALGTGWRAGIAWTDVEVTREPTGAPAIRLSGEASRVAARLGIHRWHVSLTHTREHAVASAIAEACPPRGDDAADAPSTDEP